MCYLDASLKYLKCWNVYLIFMDSLNWGPNPILKTSYFPSPADSSLYIDILQIINIANLNYFSLYPHHMIPPQKLSLHFVSRKNDNNINLVLTLIIQPLT